jgi:hypothetical protein
VIHQSTLSCILLLLLPLTLGGQVVPDSAAAEKNSSFMLATIGYTTNNNRSVPANAIRMPALLATAAWYSPFGLYASAGYYKYLAPEVNTRELEFGAGFEKSFADRFSLDLSYTHRRFSGDTVYEGIDYRHAIELSGDYRLKGLTATVDNSFLFGTTRNYFLDLILSYDFKADGFIFKNGFLLFSPTIASSLGTNWWLPETIGHTWGSPLGGIYQGNDLPGRNFTYQNFSLILPVQYTLSSFTLSVAGFYAVPSKILKRLGWTNQSGILVSLSYSIIF